MTYRPDPIDTSKVTLDPLLQELTEYLARNTHEVWASGRLAEGWKPGPRRDDPAKEHPGLVPYDQLSDSEKDFDRATALQTLKLIQALGYRIVPPEGERRRKVAQLAAAAMVPAAAGAAVQRDPADFKKLARGELVKVWQSWDRDDRSTGPDSYVAMGERALKLGEYLLAYDILRVGLRLHGGHLRLRQLEALGLARSGAAEAAIERLERLHQEGHHDEETLSGLGRAYKDQWESASDADPAKKRLLLEKAFEQYERAYQHNPGGYWSAINAATLAACLDRDARARRLADDVEAQCRQVLDRGTDGAAGDYWPLATLGEAALVRRDWAGAADWYGRAAQSARGEYGNLSSTRRNARLLLNHFGADLKLLDRWLPLPRVIVFTGHMIDQPGRAIPRFPADLEADAAAAIAARLDDLNPGWGYASGACGSDILFLEEMVRRGAEVNVVLPYELERFIEHNVAVVPGGNWEARLRKLLDPEQTKGVRLVTASQGRVEGGIADEYAGAFTFGLAGIRAWQLGAELAPLAVWDGRAGDGRGGTADTVARWRAFGCDTAIIDTREMQDRAGKPAGATPGDAAAAGGSRGGEDDAGGSGQVIDVGAGTPEQMQGHMMALLFADVVGFSKLSEEEIPLFVRHFLTPVAELAARSPHGPVQRNTWGYGLYFVFAHVHDAGLFALELRDLVAGTDWRAKGFRENLGLRTGLHVGPVYACTNPVTRQPDFIGTHVSRAARIEPITPRGQVYASEVFAAIAFAERAGGFVCEYVGNLPQHKDYGTYPTYHVRRTARG